MTGVQGELGDPLEAIEASTVLDVLDTAAASPLASLRAVPVAAPAVRPRSIAAKAKAKQLPAPPAAPTKVMKVSKAEVDAHLGVAVALLPRRIASAHVCLVVGELLHKLASTPTVGANSLPQSFVAQVLCPQTLLNSGDPVVASRMRRSAVSRWSALWRCVSGNGAEQGAPGEPRHELPRRTAPP